ncbi:MAG: hypothetical protein E7612_09300 [Ruminococcaceae bacterium]|nr:hypothetical protein [Oscillospiraceae bacterium]
MLNLEKAIIPKPKKIEAKGKTVKLTSFNRPLFEIEEKFDDVRIAEGAKIILKKISSLTPLSKGTDGYKIKISVDPENEYFRDIESEEAYFIDVSCERAVLFGKGAAGAFYAAVTFSQMLFLAGDDVAVEQSFILDWPDFMRRGHFIESRYGTEFLTTQDWYDFIDYMALMKINNITVGVYGCWGIQYDSRRMEYLYIPIKDHPEIVTPKNIKYYSVKNKKWVHEDNIIPYMYEHDSLGDIIRYAKKKNILIKPLVNSLGHNSLFPRMLPEISAKAVDGTAKGWGFCTNNEKTYEFLFGLYDYIIDTHLLPNDTYDIHIGLDEVGEAARCNCEKCNGKEHSELMIAHILKICKHLKKKGMKHIYIYHDMLYHHFNIVNEELRDLFKKEGIYDEVVLDWWTYEDPAHLFWDKAEGVNNLFHSVIKPDTGYYNWTLPTENNENIRACAKMAKDLSFEGMETYSSFEYCYDKNYLTLADVAWNNDGIDDMAEFNERYAYRNYPKNTAKAINVFNGLFDAMRDETGVMYMNRACYKFDYYFYCYRKPDKSLKEFPSGAYKLIKEDEKTFVSYLEYLKQKAAPAVEFFENSTSSSWINQNWLLTSKQYYVLSDEYLTIYGLYKSYNAGLTDAHEVIRELERLIREREALMLLAENVRIPATSYPYLRNMSVFRQFMLDLLGYFKREIAEGRKPIFDVTDLSYVTGEAFDFLR